MTDFLKTGSLTAAIFSRVLQTLESPVMRRLLFAATLLSSPLTLVAQAPAAGTPPQLALFTKLVGEWEGEATAVMGPGAKHVLRQTERVEAVAGGTAFAVRGRGYEKMPNGSEQVTFDAFAVIFLDHDHATPRMRAHSMQGGNYVDPDFTLRADGYTWSMRDPRAGLVKYEMHIDAEGRWVETGAVSRDDGATWMPIFEMKLKRTR